MKILTKNTLVAAAAATVMLSLPVIASHTWANYHWERDSNPITLPIIDSVTGDWQDEFDNTLAAWNVSSVIDLVVDSNDDSSSTRSSCSMVSGKIRICNDSYGVNGWLGLATINISGDHITQGSAQVNDSYSMSQEDRNHVMCQEVGHLFGLGHTSENGSSQETCMDYSDDPNSQWPNAHDYELLEDIYEHLDTGGNNGGGRPCRGRGCNRGNGSSFNNGHRIVAERTHEVWIRTNTDHSITVTHVYLVDGQEEH